MQRHTNGSRKVRTIVRLALAAVCAAAFPGCEHGPGAPAGHGAVTVTVNAETVALKTPAAEFDILPGGYLKAYLLRDGKRLTLDEPEAGFAGAGDYVVSAGQPIRDFTLDPVHAKVSDARGKVGPRGKRVEMTGRSASGIEKTLAVEVYDDFPGLAITTVAYKNTGSGDIPLDRVVAENRRLNATLADPKAAAYQLWSFQGSAFDWGKDEILPISKDFSRPNMVGGPGPQGLGGGIPVVDFWSAQVGEAIGHLETIPLVLSLPVKVESDGRINASVVIEADTVLKPGELYSTPRTFVAVHTGDYFEPLRTWSTALQRDGWTPPAKPDNADYAANWCGWGYEQDFTPAEMLGTIPKLKELGIRWTTLDYRWFDAYGDWNPRADTFPDDQIRRVVDEFHKQGFRMQLWWQPLAVEDGTGKHALPKPMVVSKLEKEHPDWLILDKDGKPARLISPVSTTAAMCPALPEVQEYHRKLVEKFIRDWGFDGNKMDSVYSVPRCYNPKHHHKSPDDSVHAVADVYKIIFETTRALKPDSVTQICPCGTTPNMAWLPYEDQAVTADPVGAFHVRRRIKMLKAMLGPQAAVYGDHVELSEMNQVQTAHGEDWVETGKDFASTVGTGGVLGTKFIWPDNPPRPHFRNVVLTPEKDALWKKWIGIYNARMLSEGTFLNLYTIGYDFPEGYAIEKDGKMYYAFYLPEHAAPWKGEVELRGLQPGKYRVFDYVNDKDMGVVDAASPRLDAEITAHLLLEASKI